MKSVCLVVVLAGLAAGGALSQAAESNFPERPLRYIVAFPPGGGSDIIARVVGPALTEILGQQVVIDNRSGAAGTVGATIAAQATPDGYTIFGCNIASLAVSPALYRKLAYDPGTFVPLDLIGSNPNALAVNPSVPSTSVAQFISFAKARPGQLNYGSAGVGTSPQLSMELFMMNSGIKMVHVPYKGGGPLVAGLIGGEVQAMFGTVPSLLGSIRSGKARVLGVTSKTRAPELPDVPTIAESGMPDFEVISWQGLCTPGGVPKERLGRLRAAVAAALKMPDTRRRIVEQGYQLNPLGYRKFAAFIRSERAKWAKLVKDVGIQPQ